MIGSIPSCARAKHCLVNIYQTVDRSAFSMKEVVVEEKNWFILATRKMLNVSLYIAK